MGDDDAVQPGETTDPVPEDAHHDDGLELARALTRASSRVGPKKRPKKGADASRRTGRSRVSGAYPDERDPQTLDTTVGRIVADHGWDLDLRVQGVFARWAELVGAEVAAHCTPETLDDGKLVVRAGSTAWATELRLLAPTLVRRLNEELGHGTVTLIEVLGPHGPSWKKGPRSVRDGRGPRDTYG
jgi:predicted nucleic acid-binding Zn ribbon protein